MEQLNYGEQKWNFDDVKGCIDEFLNLYEKRPVLDNLGGMTSTHLFWAWYVSRKLQPKYIIESGVFKGQGTWLFRQACPEAKIFSIDPILTQRVYIDEQVTYFLEDFSKIQWDNYLDPKVTLCFFDDHQDAYMRLMQMKWMGFEYAMFEDNYPSSQGDCYSLKKIFSQKDYILDGKEKVQILASSSHLNYVKKNIEAYTTFPPLFKNEKTRWGDDWDEENYPTPEPIFKNEDKERYPILKKEANGYTWICYVRLK